MNTSEQLEYLQELGIRAWVPKDMESEVVPDQVTSEASPPVPEIKLSDSIVDVSSFGWEELSACVQACTQCQLHASRTQAVFGVGNQQADLMVIGEAPGEDEDQQGEPFVGRAGQLLNEMLMAIGLPRETIYIANIVKCRPPENRNPHQDEAMQCADYLQRQIALIAPKVILAVGKVAAQHLLQTDLPVGKMRGNEYHYAALNIPVIVSYHPAYLLRSPKEKSKSWQDLKQVSRLLS